LENGFLCGGKIIDEKFNDISATGGDIVKKFDVEGFCSVEFLKCM